MTDDTLRMLRDSAADFAKLDAARVRRYRGARPGFERGVWQEMANMGWLAVLVPEAHAGMGLGMGAAPKIVKSTRRSSR